MRGCAILQITIELLLKQLLHKKIKVLICQIFNTQNYELTTYYFIKQIH